MKASTPAAAPRFAVHLAGGAMACVVLWGLVRIATAVSPQLAAVGLALLCGAFLCARARVQLARSRPMIACVIAVSGVAATLWAHHGTLDVADAWSTSGVACVALLLLWRNQHVAAWALMAGTIVLLGVVGGWAVVQDVGVLTTTIVLGVVAAAGRVLGWYAAQMVQYSQAEHEAIDWRTAQDAYQLAHQQRILQTGALAKEMLELIVARRGLLESAEDRMECRLLHQAIRDETRGRLLLDDEVRAHVLGHRRRGAHVQLLDDGQLGSVDPAELERLRRELAELIAGLTSDRIVIRSRTREGLDSVTIAATTSDPVAAALGQDEDEHLDLWHEISVRPRTGSGSGMEDIGEQPGMVPRPRTARRGAPELLSAALERSRMMR